VAARLSAVPLTVPNGLSMSHTPNPWAVWIIMALNRLDKPMYAGTVPAHVKARRRAKNRVARRSRRVNRGN